MAKQNIAVLRTVLIEDLCRLYDTEQKLAEALREMTGLASDKHLKNMFANHREETLKQTERLNTIARNLDADLAKEEYLVTRELVKEARELSARCPDEALRDVILAMAAAKAEHFEIACYNGAIETADYLGFSEEKKLLKENLKEEKLAARKVELALKLLLRRIDKE